MTHALITFLGRTPRGTDGYRTTVYQFPDGSESGPTALLGWTLAERLRPDRVVVLGTAGSMWDFLAEQADIADESNEDILNAWQPLADAVRDGSVAAELLEPIEPLTARYLRADGYEPEVRFRLIPGGFGEAQQLQVLGAMADAAEGCTHVTLDVSHGYRHLPMIAVVASLYLQAVRNVHVDALWYGFYDPDTKRGTAQDLRGLMHLLDWVRVLSKFEHSGDYGVIADLLATADRDDLETPMRQAAFFERTTRDSLAQQKINTITSTLNTTPLHGVAGLFQASLENRLEWTRDSTRSGRQRELARIYLERRDYLRASIYALEAFVTHRVLRAGGDPGEYEDRDTAKKEYEESGMTPSYRTLRAIRNALVHGTPPNCRIRRKMSDEGRLREAISTFLDEIPDD